MHHRARDLKGMKQNYLTAIEYGWTEDILFTKPDLSNKSTTLKMQAQTTASQLKPKQDQ